MTTMTTILGAGGPIGNELAKILAAGEQAVPPGRPQPETGCRRGIVPSRPCR